jgi:hypothetical protein
MTVAAMTSEEMAFSGDGALILCGLNEFCARHIATLRIEREVRPEHRLA